jgi:branched-chain amino acid transport system substrate-binding protein
MKRLIFLTSALLCLLVVSTAPAKEAKPAPAATKAPYKIGAIFSITGDASSLGMPEKQTAEMLMEQINAAGGINGHPLEIVIYDDKGDETEAVTMAKRLISNDQVTAIIGPSRSGTSMAIVDTVSKAEIPLVTCAASAKIVKDETGKTRKWVFMTPQSDVAAVQKIYEYFGKNKITQIAIMSDSSGYGASGRSQLQSQAKDKKIEVLADETFAPADVDMNAQLTKIKGTKAQAVVVWSIQKAPAMVAKNAQALEIKIPLFQSHGVASKKFIELCGDAADGQVLPAGRLIVVNQLPDSDPQKALLAKYKADFEAKYSPVSTFGGHAYDAITLLKKAMETAGTDNPAKVRDALEQTKGFAGTAGIFNLNSEDHNGLTKDAFVMVKIENKDWKLISQ